MHDFISITPPANASSVHRIFMNMELNQNWIFQWQSENVQPPFLLQPTDLYEMLPWNLVRWHEGGLQQEGDIGRNFQCRLVSTQNIEAVQMIFSEKAFLYSYGLIVIPETTRWFARWITTGGCLVPFCSCSPKHEKAFVILQKNTEGVGILNFFLKKPCNLNSGSSVRSRQQRFLIVSPLCEAKTRGCQGLFQSQVQPTELHVKGSQERQILS